MEISNMTAQLEICVIVLTATAFSASFLIVASNSAFAKKTFIAGGAVEEDRCFFGRSLQLSRNFPADIKQAFS